jgi:hypothetical protein
VTQLPKSKTKAEKKIECIDCGKKYKDFNEAVSKHDAKTALSHRIKPIGAPKAGARVGPITEGEIQGEIGTGTPIPQTSEGKGTQIDELLRQYPQLINPDARELTMGVEELREVDKQMAVARRDQPAIELAEIPNYVRAKGLSDTTLGKYLPHTLSCAGARIKVVRTPKLISVDCVMCKSNITLKK